MLPPFPKQESIYKMNEDKIFLMWLSQVKGLGPRRIRYLLNKYRSPIKIFGLDEKELLDLPEINKLVAKQIVESRNKLDKIKDYLEEQYNLAVSKEIQIISIFDEDYPPVLNDEKSEAPVFIYVKGNIKKLSSNAIAIGGTRNSTSLGNSIAYKLGKFFAENDWSVISGMAMGIDKASHLGALDGGGYTAAVLGCGVDVIYPKKNKDIYHQIVDSGSIVSQFPIGKHVDKDALKKRKRLMGSFSRGVVIVEAPLNSGSFNLVKYAQHRNKPVFVMSPQNNKETEGNLKLISTGKAFEIKPSDDFQKIVEMIEQWECGALNLNSKIEEVKKIHASSDPILKNIKSIKNEIEKQRVKLRKNEILQCNEFIN